MCWKIRYDGKSGKLFGFRGEINKATIEFWKSGNQYDGKSGNLFWFHPEINKEIWKTFWFSRMRQRSSPKRRWWFVFGETENARGPRARMHHCTHDAVASARSPVSRPDMAPRRHNLYCRRTTDVPDATPNSGGLWHCLVHIRTPWVAAPSLHVIRPHSPFWQRMKANSGPSPMTHAIRVRVVSILETKHILVFIAAILIKNYL